MLLLVAALLIQGEPTLDDRIAAFVKGDPEAEAALLKAGVAAIAPLRKAREKNPEKVDALVYELKKAAAYPRKSPELLKALDGKVTCAFDKKPYKEALHVLQEAAAINLLIDGGKKADAITFSKESAPVWQALDQTCVQSGLDYGLFHNSIVIAPPSRLWGEGKTRGAFGPPGTDSQHLRPEDQVPLEKVRLIQVSLDFQNADVANVVAYLGEVSGLKLALASKPAEGFDLRAKDIRAMDALALVTQARGLDFVVIEGKVVIDTRAEIDKKVAGKK